MSAPASSCPPILLLGNYVHDGQQSMQRYAELLLAGLVSRGLCVRLLRPRPVFGRLRPGASGLGKLLGYVDKFLVFPLELAVWRWREPTALVHICDHSNAMYVPLVGERHLVTCHDLLAIRGARGEIPEGRVGWSGRILQAWILSGLRRAAHIVCVSHETKRQLKVLGGFAKARVDVVPNGLNYPYRPLSPAESAACFDADPALCALKDVRYVFHVGGNQWYKNRAGVLRIYLSMLSLRPSAPDLVLAGKPFSAEMRALLSGHPMAHRVHYVGTVDNTALNALYARAECLLFPSLEEGFGWPLIEAMAAGCPVLTSDRAPMTEIGGEAVAYLNPADENGAAAVLDRLLSMNNSGRMNFITIGYSRAGLYSTERMITETLVLYRLIENSDI